MGNYDSSSLSESQAIELVQSNFPELREYPSNSLPPKSISAEKVGASWKIAFVQEGSGRPILGAKCYLVKNESGFSRVIFLGEFSSVSPGFEEASLKVCKSGCMLQGCHGLDLSCSSNIPEFCTEMYGLGDKCRRFAKCEIIDGNCTLSKNPEFDNCKSCVEKCQDQSGSDTVKLFDCEGLCGRQTSEY